MADNVVFFPLDITYRIENNKAIIHLFVRTNDNKQICVIDENFDAATGGVGDGDLILVSNLEATVGCKSDRSFARQIDRKSFSAKVSPGIDTSGLMIGASGNEIE